MRGRGAALTTSLTGGLDGLPPPALGAKYGPRRGPVVHAIDATRRTQSARRLPCQRGLRGL
eukprot:483232-Lingulodinium_polyedra.AAC.1